MGFCGISENLSFSCRPVLASRPIGIVLRSGFFFFQACAHIYKVTN